MPYQKGTVPKQLQGKGIPQQFVDQFVAVVNSVLKNGGDEKSAFRHAYAVMTRALRKEGYRQGKDGKWHKGSRKEELEPEVLTFPSGEITIDEGQSIEQALVSGLNYSGTALIDHAVSQQGSWRERYYSPGYNDRCMAYTNEYMKLGYPVTVYNRHDSAQWSTVNPIGAIVAPLERAGDEIRYKARISPTVPGKEVIQLVFDGVMHPTSVRQYEVKAKSRRVLDSGDDDNDDSGEERWILELLEGRIGGIDFCDQPGINGAGIKRLEGMPSFAKLTGDEEVTRLTTYSSRTITAGALDPMDFANSEYEEDTDTEDDMDWKEITLELLKEHRPDLLSAHTAAGLEVLATVNASQKAKITELEARQMPPDLTAENAQLKAGIVVAQQQVAEAQWQTQIEVAAHTLVGREIAKQMRAETLTPENLAEVAKRVRDAAIMEAATAFGPDEGIPKGKAQPRDKDDIDIDAIPIPNVFAQAPTPKNPMEAIFGNTI